MKWLFIWILRLFRVCSKHDIDAISISIKIDGFSRHGLFDQAQALRQQALERIPVIHLAPVLRSQGEYLLKDKDYHGALNAFKQALLSLDQNPILMGSTYPLRVYAGASAASLLIGDKELAKEYFEKLASFYEHFKQDKDMLERFDWLKRHLLDTEEKR